MTLTEFRIAHSLIIEHYQFIEFNLEGIYALLSGKEFSEGLKDVDLDSLGRIIRKIENMNFFSEEDFQKLQKILKKRNFWCHNCYVDLIFDYKTGNLKKISDAKMLQSDIREAKEIRDWLFQLKMSLWPSK